MVCNRTLLLGIRLITLFVVLSSRRAIKARHQTGQETHLRTFITNKRWKGTKKIELLIEHRPKGLTEKFMLDSKEYYNWLKGNILEIEYLAKSGQLLRYSKVEATNDLPLVAAK